MIFERISATDRTPPSSLHSKRLFRVAFLCSCVMLNYAVRRRRRRKTETVINLKAVNHSRWAAEAESSDRTTKTTLTASSAGGHTESREVIHIRVYSESDNDMEDLYCALMNRRSDESAAQYRGSVSDCRGSRPTAQWSVPWCFQETVFSLNQRGGEALTDIH